MSERCEYIRTSGNTHWCALAAAPRQWVGLTDEDMQECIKTADYNQGQYKRTPYWAHLATAIEARLKELNT